MNDIESVTTPAHPDSEAPVSKEIRDRAAGDLESIKQLIEEGRQSGELKPEDEAVLHEWLVQDVQKPLAQADQLDTERHAVMASAAVNSAVEGTMLYQERDGTLTSPEAHQELVNSGENQPALGGRVND